MPLGFATCLPIQDSLVCQILTKQIYSSTRQNRENSKTKENEKVQCHEIVVLLKSVLWLWV